jgi:mRNA interferase MazF
MKRGDVVIVSLAGDYGKPRPAILVQIDELTEHVDGVIVAPLTTTLLRVPLYRPTISPSPENGILKISQVMTDKLSAVSKTKISKIIGHADAPTMALIDRTLAFVLGLAE